MPYNKKKVPLRVRLEEDAPSEIVLKDDPKDKKNQTRRDNKSEENEGKNKNMPATFGKPDPSDSDYSRRAYDGKERNINWSGRAASKKMKKTLAAQEFPSEVTPIWVHGREGQSNQKVNGQKEGYWIGLYGDGRPSYKGNYKNGNPDGYWEAYWRDGSLHYRGSYVNNLRNGPWEVYSFDGELLGKVNYVNGIPEEDIYSDFGKSEMLEENKPSIISESSILSYIRDAGNVHANCEHFNEWSGLCSIFEIKVEPKDDAEIVINDELVPCYKFKDALTGLKRKEYHEWEYSKVPAAAIEKRGSDDKDLAFMFKNGAQMEFVDFFGRLVAVVNEADLKDADLSNEAWKMAQEASKTVIEYVNSKIDKLAEERKEEEKEREEGVETDEESDDNKTKKEIKIDKDKVTNKETKTTTKKESATIDRVNPVSEVYKPTHYKKNPQDTEQKKKEQPKKSFKDMLDEKLKEETNPMEVTAHEKPVENQIKMEIIKLYRKYFSGDSSNWRAIQEELYRRFPKNKKDVDQYLSRGPGKEASLRQASNKLAEILGETEEECAFCDKLKALPFVTAVLDDVEIEIEQEGFNTMVDELGNAGTFRKEASAMEDDVLQWLAKNLEWEKTAVLQPGEQERLAELEAKAQNNNILPDEQQELDKLRAKQNAPAEAAGVGPGEVSSAGTTTATAPTPTGGTI